MGLRCNVRKYLETKKGKILASVSCLAVVSIALSALYFISSEEAISVSIKDFKPGVKVSYEVDGNKGQLLTGQTLVDSDGNANLPIPLNLVSNTEQNIAYKLKLTNPKMENVNALELLMNLDTKKKEISVSGVGFDDFSDVSIKNGSKQFITKTDWSGIFNQDIPVSKDILEFAFRGNDLASDAILGDNAKIEVLGGLFGEGSRDGIGTVQARYGKALVMMGTELSFVMILQTEIIGTFFDAKIQLETQRKIQELKARAHKDYHPSEQMCRFGSFIKSIASTESKSDADKKFMNKILMDTYLNTTGNVAEEGEATAAIARIEIFKKHYCDPQDNNGTLDLMCKEHANMDALTPQQRERLNKDIDYTRTLDTKLTLDIDFANATPAPAMTPVLTDDELDVITLAKNLYIPQNFGSPDKDSINRDPRGHFESRSYAAKMNVAHTSFLSIVGMKAEAPEGKPTTAIASLPNLPTNMQVNTASPNLRTGPIADKALVLTEDAGWSYMKAMMREFGLPDENGNGTKDDEIEKMLGLRPSYYAQMEVLTKKIYQSPNFYTNLYDKPANVKRIGVAMDAIGLMQLRDSYDSQLRQEMITAVLVEQGLLPFAEQVSTELYSGMKQQQSP